MLLCERCGYVLDGSPRDGPCPECGRPVRDSLPEFRPGTPWQQRRSLKTWWTTNVGMVTRPRQMFEVMRVPTRRQGSPRLTDLSVYNCAGAVAPFAIIATFLSSRRDGFIMFSVGVIALVALTEIEALGLRFIARRRGWRVSWRLARAICAHASIGWAALFPFAVLSWLFLVVVQIVFDVAPWSDWLFVSNMVIWLLPPMLCFETLAYLGVRACKYANANVVEPEVNQRSSRS